MAFPDDTLEGIALLNAFLQGDAVSVAVAAKGMTDEDAIGTLGHIGLLLLSIVASETGMTAEQVLQKLAADVASADPE